MPGITEFHIAASHTINLGDYNSIKIEAGLVVAVGEDAPLDEMKAMAQVELRKLLEETYQAQKRREPFARR